MKRLTCLHIIGSRSSGGAERFYTRLVHALQERGHQVICVNRPDSAVSSELAPDIEQVHVSMRNVRDPFSRMRISRMLSERRPDIVQTYMGRATRLTHLRSSSPTIHVSRLGGFYKLDGYRHADAWIGNTEAVCSYMIRNGFPARRVFHLPNFLEVPSRQTREALEGTRARMGIPRDAAVVLGLGRFIPKKGFSLLIHGFSKIPPAIGGRPVYLLMVGSGPEQKALKRWSEQLQVQGRIRWAGWQSDPDPFFALADLFVCPSHHEPLGNVILEAWSNGVPVISTETDGALELIRDGVNGLLVPPGDPDALAERMEHVLRLDRTALQDLALKGSAELNLRFGKEAVVSSYIDLYETLVASGPQRGPRL